MLNPTHSVFNSLALFLVLCFSGQLTGGHCNPAVTLALLISKGNRIRIPVALAYIFSQFLGAIAGGAIAYGLVPTFNFVEKSAENSIIDVIEVKILLGQIFGTFIYALFVLIIMNDHTSFVKSTFWNYCLIPVVSFIAREGSYQIDSLNPATAFSFQLFTGLKDNDWVPLSHYYLYFFGPAVGALLSGVFFNYFYLPLLIRWKAKK
jgi:glycerol uptake facilitator-like aquaporin